MKPNYEISILISVYNGVEFIPHFLNDICRQTIFRNCFFLFLDANSSDESGKLIQNFTKSFTNMKYHLFQERYGIYKTWNEGIKISNTEYLSNWNLDDRRFPDSLENQLKAFEDDIDLVYGPTLTTHNKNEFPEMCDSKYGFGCFEPTKETMIVNNSPHCLPMWRKSLHDRFGLFDESYKSAGDYEMWLRAMWGGAKFKKIDKLIGTYYRNPEGISSGSASYEAALKEVGKVIDIYRNK